MIKEIPEICSDHPFIAVKKLGCHHEVVKIPSIDPEKFMTVLKQEFRKTYWMECNDIYGNGESVTIIGAHPIASLSIRDLHSVTTFEKGKQTRLHFKSNEEQVQFADKWIKIIQPYAAEQCRYNGLFGYCSYNAVQLSEDIRLASYNNASDEVPLMQFNLYRYIFVFRKSAGEVLLINNSYGQGTGELARMKRWLFTERTCQLSSFRVSSEIKTDCTEAEFINKVHQAKKHCLKGDIFQVVLSRKFSRACGGDPWTFFKALKETNPSPFMFYMDEDDFQITGTSPEIHFQAVQGEGCINPIAGTYKRCGAPEQENESVNRLLNDPKENAEHVMLVDLARNDLNRIASKVYVSQFKTIERYSHVIHIVSRVRGEMPESYGSYRSVMDVFPAGTLSGAPKYRAMEIIDTLESSSRSFYGGLLGWIGFNGDINTCILIRSALFKNNEMTYRAGAGIVVSSVPELELEEVANKLKAISTSLERFQE